MRDGTPSCLVTGANGFVGTALCRRLLREGFGVRRVLRSPSQDGLSAPAAGLETVVLGDLCRGPDWDSVLHGVDVVFHLAARVHVMKDTAADPLAEFQKVNVECTRRLAEAALQGGVRRFVFLSSIKVNGEETPDRPFTEENVPAPSDPYALSKWQAEQFLLQIAHQGRMGVIILRPPLVYGPMVRGNFLELIRLVQRGLPLPLGSVRNRRSFIYVENLADLLAHCVSPTEAGGVFLVSDGEDLSTPDLIRRLARALQKRSWLMPVPPLLLRFAGKVLGKQAMVERLCGSLTVDGERARRLLHWSPPYSVDEGLEKTGAWYLATHRGEE